MSQRAGEAIAAGRVAGPFCSWHDFVRRTGLRRPELARLAQARALDSLRLNRRHGLWQALGEAADQDRPLFASIEDEEREAPLPGMTAYEEVLADYRTAGLSLGQHPIAFFREQLNAQRCLPAGQLAGCRTGRIVRVAGIIILRQRPSTARGIIFMTLEDETGIANLIVRPHIWQRFHRVAARASAVIVQGQLQHQEEVIHVIAQQFTDLATLSRNIDSQSRDFH